MIEMNSPFSTSRLTSASATVSMRRCGRPSRCREVESWKSRFSCRREKHNVLEGDGFEVQVVAHVGDNQFVAFGRARHDLDLVDAGEAEDQRHADGAIAAHHEAAARAVVGERAALDAERPRLAVGDDVDVDAQAGRRPSRAGSASATVKRITPFSTVGKTVVIVPAIGCSLTSTTAGIPARSSPACTSETVASTRYNDRSASRAMTSPLRTSPPSCDSAQVTTPARSDGSSTARPAGEPGSLPCRACRARATACRARPWSTPRCWRAPRAAHPARRGPGSAPARTAGHVA